MKLSMVALSVNVALGCNDLSVHRQLYMFIQESINKRYYCASN